MMADKNPKHPLKKKKATQKINVADHTIDQEAAAAKHKKHVYYITVAGVLNSDLIRLLFFCFFIKSYRLWIW